VGRGVLLDYYSYAQQNGIHYSAVEAHLVTAKGLEACAKAQNLIFETGDILFVRMGFTEWYEKASEQERLEGLEVPELVGIRQDTEELEWFWYVISCVIIAPLTAVGIIISQPWLLILPLLKCALLYRNGTSTNIF